RVAGGPRHRVPRAGRRVAHHRVARGGPPARDAARRTAARPRAPRTVLAGGGVRRPVPRPDLPDRAAARDRARASVVVAAASSAAPSTHRAAAALRTHLYGRILTMKTMLAALAA